MSGITTRSDVTVEQVYAVGSDAFVVACARVSTLGAASRPDELLTAEATERRIRSYVRNKHSGVFEHCTLCVRVEAPAFVWWQWVRHRTMSYSLESSRYREVAPVFWAPPPGRAMFRPEGFRPMAPRFDAGDETDEGAVKSELFDAYAGSWRAYRALIDREGVAGEVARACLPFAAYYAGYVTANLRNWLNFLSLRTAEPEAESPGHPQAEIVQAARRCEGLIERQWPLTCKAWRELRRPSLEDL
jgi:thymidylate synthase (FAD)